MLEYIERLRNQPEPVRKQAAVVTASVLTGLIALGWAGAVVSDASFALRSTPSSSPTLANSTGSFSESVAEARSGFTELLGAAGAAQSGSNAPELVIVDSTTSTTLDTQMSAPEDTRTVIPF